MKWINALIIKTVDCFYLSLNNTLAFPLQAQYLLVTSNYDLFSPYTDAFIHNSILSLILS